MKITIEAETDDEKKLPILQQSWVRTGCIRFGLSGIGERTAEQPTGEFGFLHGDSIGIKGDLTRLSANLDAQMMSQVSVNGVLQAHQMIANAQRDQRITQELVENRNGLKLRQD